MQLIRSIALSSFALGVSLITLTGAEGAPPTPDCSVHKLQGSYVFNGQGTNFHYGVFEFDGSGNFFGRQTSIRPLNAAPRENLRGTYAVNADCTGTMVMD